MAVVKLHDIGQSQLKKAEERTEEIRNELKEVIQQMDCKYQSIERKN